MCNIFVFGHTRPFPVCVVAVAVLSTTCQLFIVLRVWALTFISFFATSPRLVTRADPFDAMCRCVGQILAPWDGWTWTYTVLLLYKPWHPILTVFFGDIPFLEPAGKFSWTGMFSWPRVPSIEDGLLDDYGGYDLRYRSSLHPVFLCIHLWMLTYMYGIAPYN